MTWHRDFPKGAREVWDVLAKALMIRAGGVAVVYEHELREAASTQAEIELGEHGEITFRVERQ